MYEILRRDLPQWRRIRAGLWSAAEVRAVATALRSGDWRAAAELVDTDVDVDLHEVRRRFGATAAAAIEDDLHHLRLDLLWWQLPRHRGGRTTLLPRVSAVLCPDEGADTAPLLRVRLPNSPVGPQRLHLSVTTFEDLDGQRFYVAPRYSWDVRHTGALRTAWGGSPTRMPLFTADARPIGSAFGVGDDAAAVTERLYRHLIDGETAAAWTAADIAGDVTAEVNRSGLPTCPVGLADAARAAGRAFGVDEVETLYNAYVRLSVDGMGATVADPADWMEVPVKVLASPVPVDLVLVAAGHLRPDDLHPLVREALFPTVPASDGPAFDGAPAFVGRSRRGSVVGEPVRVRCRDRAWHTMAVTGGALRPLDHDDSEVERERVHRSLGGASTGCFAVLRDWYTPATRRLPRGLVAQCGEVRQRMQHGDTDWLLDGLARGVIDPHGRVADGWTLLHMLMWVDHERALPLLLDAGLDVDARDRIGRTPLYVTVMNHGPVALVRALFEAGADPTAETVHGAATLYTAVYRSGRKDVGFLEGKG